MARVPYVEYDEATPRIRKLYDTITYAMGRASNNAKLIAHAPHLLPWHFGLNLAVSRAGTGRLSPQLKNAIILRVSAVNACDYCIDHNTQFGQAAGVKAQKMEALQRDDYRERTDLFDASELAALRWAESVARNEARRDMDAFAELNEHFGDAEIVEITYIAAHRTMQNLIQEALWNDTEGAGTPKNDRVQLPEAFFASYVRDVLPEVVEDPQPSRGV